MSNERKACASADRWRFDKTDSHCSFALSKSNFCWFVNSRPPNRPESFNNRWMSAYERTWSKEKSNFQFEKCSRPLTRKCPLTGMCKYRVWLRSKKWELKKVSVVELPAYESVLHGRVDFTCTMMIKLILFLIFHSQHRPNTMLPRLNQQESTKSGLFARSLLVEDIHMNSWFSTDRNVSCILASVCISLHII